jgi:hypothetical protein
MATASRRPTTRKKPALPRAPLPRQTGGLHEDKTKRPVRKQKHRRPPSNDD